MNSIRVRVTLMLVGSILCVVVLSTLVMSKMVIDLVEGNFHGKPGELAIPDPTPEDIKKLKRNIFLSRMGMALIVVGGFLEILSNYYCEP